MALPNTVAHGQKTRVGLLLFSLLLPCAILAQTTTHNSDDNAGAGDYTFGGAANDTHILSGDNTYTGATEITNGILQLPNLTPLAGARLWLDATDSAMTGATNNGDPVTTWQNSILPGTEDLGLQLRPIGLGGGTNPTLLTNGINGRPAVRFNGTSALFNTADYTGSRTIFSAGQKENAAPSGRLITSTFNNWLQGWYLGDSVDVSYYEGWVTNPGTTDDFQARVYTSAMGPPSNLFSNGDIVTPTISTVPSTGPNGLSLGVWGPLNPAWSEPTIGRVGEVLIYDTAFTAPNRIQNEAYLSSRWRGSETNNIPDTSTLDLIGTAQFDLNGNTETIGGLTGPGTTAVLMNGGTLSVGANNAVTTYSGAISGAGTLIKVGNNSLDLQGDNSGFTGDIEINGGSLVAGTINALGDATGDTTVNIGGALQLVHSLSYPAGETLVLNGGKLNAAAGAGPFTTWNGPVNLTAGSTIGLPTASRLEITGNITGNGLLTISGDTASGKAIRLSGTNSWTGGTSVSGGISLEIMSTGNLPGDIVLADGNTLLRYEGGTHTYGGIASGGGRLQVAVSGAATDLTLTGASTYVADTLIGSNGTIRIDGASDRLPTDNRVDVHGNLRLLNGHHQTIDRLTGTGTVHLGSSTLTVGSNGGASSFSGNVTGTGTIATIGSGTFSFTGTNTAYTGNYALSNNNDAIFATITAMGDPSSIQLGSGTRLDLTAVTNGGGTFNGSGTNTGTTTTYSGTGIIDATGGDFNSAGVAFSPGNSPGIMPVTGGLTGIGTYNWELFSGALGAGVGWDLITVTGTFDVDVGGTLNLLGLNSITPDTAGTPIGFNPTDNLSFEILTASSVTGNTALINIIPDGFLSAGGAVWTVGFVGNSLMLHLNGGGPSPAVPEPGTWALFSLLLMGAIAYRRQQRQHTSH